MEMYFSLVEKLEQARELCLVKLSGVQAPSVLAILLCPIQDFYLWTQKLPPHHVTPGPTSKWKKGEEGYSLEVAHRLRPFPRPYVLTAFVL